MFMYAFTGCMCDDFLLHVLRDIVVNSLVVSDSFVVAIIGHWREFEQIYQFAQISSNVRVSQEN